MSIMTLKQESPSPSKGGATPTKPTFVGWEIHSLVGLRKCSDTLLAETRIALTLEGWGYTYKAHLRGLEILKPTKVGFVNVAIPF